MKIKAETTFESNQAAALRTMNTRSNLALDAVGFYIEGEAAIRAPVEFGDLRRDMDHVVNRSTQQLFVGNKSAYAATQEFGDPKRNIRAQPYLRPAVQENKRTIEKLAQRIFGTGDKSVIRTLDSAARSQKTSKSPRKGK